MSPVYVLKRTDRIDPFHDRVRDAIDIFRVGCTLAGDHSLTIQPGCAEGVALWTQLASIPWPVH